jgi:RimJ/RimL family protein N-acetyltransferase
MEQSCWSLFNLRIRNARVEIRLASDDDLDALARLASLGVHDPATMPFLKPWTDEPSPQLERGLLQWGWSHRAAWRPESWTFNGAVVVDGEVVGVQDASAEHFADRRVVKTGSWLGREFQGRGVGTAMRAAMLAFVFDGLGAESAISGGFVDNPASLGVSRKFGYDESGRRTVSRRGQDAIVLELQLDRATWDRQAHDSVEILGLDACREFFGA